MPFIKLQFRPGINRETTAYTNEGGWIDGDKIRFRAGLPETIGGWERYSQQAMLGVPRSLFPWAALDSSTYIGAGTQLKYYILDGGTPNDITPIRATTAAGEATFAAANGSTTLVVSDTSHGAAINDFVTFSAAVSLGGVVTAAVLNVEHQITSIVDSNSYQIQIAVAANASDTGDGGAGTIAAYQLTVGLDSAILGSGWGAGAWSRGGWGSAADVSIPGAQLRVWSQDNFGEDLLICPRGGPIFLWDTSAGLAARAVNITALVGSSEAPTVAQQVIVSERDRHTIAFGCDSQFSGGLRTHCWSAFPAKRPCLTGMSQAPQTQLAKSGWGLAPSSSQRCRPSSRSLFSPICRCTPCSLSAPLSRSVLKKWRRASL